ncbi:unnamed protein product [Nippostrongylus brasiliensis]|uniref:WW domain-containing protein n=1 Tax=Nippostrongylus brasiliensis TaxID=27835 RepID=A0A0N4YF73_NIPBR|nr:unnamed protein product [Nippostrongylus brasiliensis]
MKLTENEDSKWDERVWNGLEENKAVASESWTAKYDQPEWIHEPPGLALSRSQLSPFCCFFCSSASRAMPTNST